MRRNAWVILGVLALAACQRGGSVFFDGGLDEALARAREHDTLVMAEFYTDW